jgi:undecaprenyl-diphosphatase
MNQLNRLDERVFNWIAVHPKLQTNQNIPKIFVRISKSGDGYCYALLIGLALLADDTLGQVFFMTSALAFAIEIPLYITLKHTFKRQRPCDTFTQFCALVQPADKFSLPSGHTAAAFLMATICAHFYPSCMIFAFSWATLIGMSRMILKVHFALDIIVGAILGTAVALFCILLIDTMSLI